MGFLIVVFTKEKSNEMCVPDSKMFIEYHTLFLIQCIIFVEIVLEAHDCFKGK